LIGNANAQYLNSLGITTADGVIKKDKQHKYKQINRYVEIMADVIRQANLQQALHIVDMGSGKGYLTFALAEYLATALPTATITGVEMRQDMVELCNNIATQNKFGHLHFVQGTIQQTTVDAMNVLIALHACDTATDDVLKKGIAADAQIIVCAPCCHKQIRNAMQPNEILQTVTKHGILLERQAEIATDALRALWLESKGYKTKVFDFVDVNDTPKNVMIVATKTTRTDAEKNNYAQQFVALKQLFRIQWCAIEQ
jgi:SAM-dependent methyltransferase